MNISLQCPQLAKKRSGINDYVHMKNKCIGFELKIKPTDTDIVNILFCIHTKSKSQEPFPCIRAKTW